MTDTGAERKTAGALLRAAREKQGLHIAALAAAIKVAPRKLDALEHDRYDELPDATFTRALAQTVCRTLKIDPQPVLALLPVAEPAVLDTVSGALNAPFRDRPSREDGVGLAAAAVRPMVWAGVGLLVASAVVYFAPAHLWQSAPEAVRAAATAASAVLPSRSAPPPAEPATTVTEIAAPVVLSPAAASEPAPAVPLPTPAVTAMAEAPLDAAPAAPLTPRLVQLRADGDTWVEARDARGQVVFSRLVQRGENVGFDGVLPIRLTVGNAPVTRVSLRGKAVDLGPATRENVARIELQ